MIFYNTKDWFIAIFNFHKSDTFRALLLMLIFIAFYSWGIVYLELHVLKMNDKSLAKNVTIMHSLLGFAISMLLVFRTNTAYARWWEGRKLWGALVNNSLNLAIKLNVMLNENDLASRTFFKQIIPLYALSLQRHLHKDSTLFELDEKVHPELPSLNSVPHVPNKVADSIIKKIHQLYVEQKYLANNCFF